MNKIIDPDYFQYWIFQMDDVLERFMEWMKLDQAVDLELNLNSLDLLEEWLLKRYPSYLDILKFSEATILDACSRFLGEVARKALGGVWMVEFSNPKDGHYGYPYIHRTGGTPYIPENHVTAACDRRTGDYLSRYIIRH